MDRPLFTITNTLQWLAWWKWLDNRSLLWWDYNKWYRKYIGCWSYISNADPKRLTHI